MTLLRITSSYLIGSTGERAANTLHLETPGFPGTLADVAPLQVPLQAWWDRIRMLLANVVTPERLRADEISAVTGATIRGWDLTTLVGSGFGGANLLPPQCSVVLSMRTDQSGPRYRGRMYLPPSSTAQLTAAGRLNTAARDELADATRDMLVAAAALPTPWTGVVWSKVAAATTEITAVGCGDVFDTQRRRREDLVEQRVIVPV